MLAPGRSPPDRACCKLMINRGGRIDDRPDMNIGNNNNKDINSAEALWPFLRCGTSQQYLRGFQGHTSVDQEK